MTTESDAVTAAIWHAPSGARSKPASATSSGIVCSGCYTDAIDMLPTAAEWHGRRKFAAAING